MSKLTNSLSVFFVIILLFISSCGVEKKDKKTERTGALDYPVLTLSLRKAALQNSYPATMEGQQNIEIRPKIDGYIEEIYVDEGTLVKKGQRLFKINAPHYEQEMRTAQAAIKIAEANLHTAQMELDKVRPLVERNIISKHQLDAAEYNLKSRQAALAQSQAALENAAINIGYTLISSPVDGVVGTLPYKIGSLVNANTPLPLTLVSDTSTIFAYFSINEKDALDLFSNLGSNTAAVLASLPPVELLLSNNTKFSEKGRIDATSGSVNISTGSIRVRARFPNPEGRIRSGSSGVVILPMTVDDAIVIPQKSTYEIQGSKFVYVIDNENKAVSTAITVMDNNDGQFYVVTGGLKAGDRIALEGLPSLRDGVTIEPRLVHADSIYKNTRPI